MRALSLFSGIGGLDIAASWAGIETALFCEIEPYAVKVLKRRWPDVPILPDVKEIDGRDWAVDLIHGGFPCQDLSTAGKRAGLTGERSGLWFEMLRVIAGARPRWVLAENVRGAVNLALDTVCSGLGDEGYKVWPFVLPASAFGAPHQRERLFVVGCREDIADALNARFQGDERGCSFPDEGEAAFEPTAERGEACGKLWPTPRSGKTSDEKLETWLVRQARGDVATPPLSLAVKMWPTPQASVGTYDLNWEATDGRSKPNKLGWAVRGAMWPTPRGGETGVGMCGGTGHWEMLKNGVGPEMAALMGGRSSGQLNPAWVEILMGYPLGWTDVDCESPEPWPGWPAQMGARLWMTPKSGACGMTAKTSGRPLEMATHLSSQIFVSERDGADQYPYEPPRTVTGCKNRAKRLKCLGNSVVPQQAYPIFRAIAEMEAMAP